SCYAWTRVVDNRSPWFALNRPGDLHRVPLSHGEGKFVASDDVLSSLIANGQIATQYCDADGMPSMDIAINPNGSISAIEGITSPCGRVLGKMGHSERRGVNVAKNVPGDKFQPIFAAGVRWFA
ncbi:MAG: phosphoribosylformylglycinamidine synthase subunit PurQ, partial [Verrucomicrobiae bacterium]|nr:phosphoribosylformylglycinamidine synthase subunit PurQ [Verrucomicrobiae bacterium]